MSIATTLLALIATQSSPAPDPASYLSGTWASVPPRAPIDGQQQSITFTATSIAWRTYEELITTMNQQGELIRVRTAGTSTYMFEKIDQNTMCMVAPHRRGIIAVPQGGQDIRPTVRDGLMTVNCYRRQPQT